MAQKPQYTEEQTRIMDLERYVKQLRAEVCYMLDRRVQLVDGEDPIIETLMDLKSCRKSQLICHVLNNGGTGADADTIVSLLKRLDSAALSLTVPDTVPGMIEILRSFQK